MANSDLNELLSALLPAAEMLLTKHGEFYPIGAIMLPEGEVKHVGAVIEGDDHPPSQKLIDQLSEILKQEAAAGKLRAAGICCDVLITPPGKSQKQDAIRCSLEHRLGEAVEVFVPYVRTQDGAVQFDEIFASQRTPQFFA